VAGLEANAKGSGMKRFLLGSVIALGVIAGAPAFSGASPPADTPQPPVVNQCRPAAIHHLGMRLEKQEAAGHDRRCNRIERHIAILQSRCDAPAG